MLSSPLILISMAAIKLTSPGPAIYKQERITINNKPFRLYKLRTMRQGAEDGTGPVVSPANDPRVTRIGRLLRLTRLDELPQFINVLMGDMSVVGPRPERPCFTERYEEECPGYGYRAAVKAGITGYAQLMGKYATSASDKLRFDLWYIKNYSLWLDITLVIKTIKVLFMKGSAA
jgi:lipopolysaccharide/colanic/teichoic acid biosynthesis glycosyltransferase